MFLWWRGYGGFFVVIPLYFAHYFLKDKNLPDYVLFIIAAAVCGITALFLEKKRKGMDSFLSISVKYWALIYGAIAIALLYNPKIFDFIDASLTHYHKP